MTAKLSQFQKIAGNYEVNTTIVKGKISTSKAKLECNLEILFFIIILSFTVNTSFCYFHKGENLFLTNPLIYNLTIKPVHRLPRKIKNTSIRRLRAPLPIIIAYEKIEYDSSLYKDC